MRYLSGCIIAIASIAMVSAFRPNLPHLAKICVDHPEVMLKMDERGNKLKNPTKNYYQCDRSQLLHCDSASPCKSVFELKRLKTDATVPVPPPKPLQPVKASPPAPIKLTKV
jgi:hypothetical protein